MASISATTANACGCCGAPPAPSSCVMLVGDEFGTPRPGNGTDFVGGNPWSDFSNYTSAQNNVQVFDLSTSASIVADCYALCLRAGLSPAASLTFTGSSFSLTITADVVQAYVCFSAKSGDTVTISSGTTQPWSVYDASTISPIAGGPPSGSFAVPADGTYIMALIFPSPSTRTVTSSGSIVLNPVVALWDDSGTTRQLEACPRLEIIPTLFSPFGAPLYANTAAADADFASYVSNCVGVITQNPAFRIGFTATDGGTSLELDGENSIFAVNMYGSVNALGGQTLTFTFTLTADLGTPTVTFTIIDNEGNVVQTIGPTGTSPQTSSALPFSGNYLINVSCTSDDPSAADVHCDVTITSSGTMSVNPVAALVDSGTDCPLIYDC